MSTAIFYITRNGLGLARKLAGLYPDADLKKFSSEAVAASWPKSRRLVFITAAGIAVRAIAPLIEDKKTDPAVIVLDEKGQFAVSLLSGHLGGGNEAAREIADFLHAEAIITTASDVNRMTSIDLWARDNNLAIGDWELVPKIGTRLIDNGTLKIYSEIPGLELPDDFQGVEDPSSADIVITTKQPVDSRGRKLFLHPRVLVVGIGCNSGTSADEIEGAVREVFKKHNLAFPSILSLATIDKKGSEPGLIAFSGRYKLGIAVFNPDELNRVQGVSRSEAALKATGAHAVAEPAALLASGSAGLLVQKQKAGNVTIAVAERKGRNAPSRKGKVTVVGTGPGSIDHITPYAQSAIRKADIIVGYGTYLDLIGELIRGKEVFSTGMTQETDRCGKAVELALEGKTVVVISGGDPGIYAMAGLVLEIIRAEEEKKKTSGLAVEIIPGISALNACAARLGAPLMHDFASISLSDRLTQWGLIEKRLDAAAMADFVIVLYNPKSKGRVEHIERAREIILKHRPGGTPVGIVKGAMREDERVVITDLGSMLDHDIDMQTTVIIGNSRTFAWNGLMVTPRGYESKK